MARKEKMYKNKAIIQLKDSGWGFSDIAKAFEITDKRNIVHKYKRWREKYSKKVEKKSLQTKK